MTIEKDNITYVGSCPSNSLEVELKYNIETAVPHNVSDLNDAMCSAYNHTGLLCRRCEGDLGPAVLSILILVNVMNMDGHFLSF